MVFLDEPTIGMDVVVKQQVREFLRDQVTRRGRTVLLTTHDMSEVARLAGRVALIDRGRLVFDGPVSRLHSLVGAQWQVHATLEHAVPEARVPGARIAGRDGAELILEPDGTEPLHPRDLVRRALEQLPVIDISVSEPDLEDVVRAAFGRRPATAGQAGEPAP